MYANIIIVCGIQYGCVILCCIIILGITITRTSLVTSDILPDYSYINPVPTNTDVLIARCVTGLGPNDDDDNNALGGLYFNGNRIPNGVCGSSVVQPNGTSLDNFVGVIDMFQCGAFSFAEEGVYTCTMMTSSMMNQSIRLGIYLTGRSKLP